MMKSSMMMRGVLALAALSLVAAACGDDEDTTAATSAAVVTEAPPATEAPVATEAPMDTQAPMDTEAPMDTGAVMVDSSELCDAEELVAAVQGGGEEGTLEGMADDPVATAASNNPVLTTLTTAVGAAGLGDTLNSAEALTVFAPTDCAFAALDPATLEAALADPTGLLTTVLGFHVIVGERYTADTLAGVTELETFTGETLTVEADGGTITLNGTTTVLVPDIMTANANVFLIDSVMLPPSIAG